MAMVMDYDEQTWRLEVSRGGARTWACSRSVDSHMTDKDGIFQLTTEELEAVIERAIMAAIEEACALAKHRRFAKEKYSQALHAAMFFCAVVDGVEIPESRREQAKARKDELWAEAERWRDIADGT